MKVILTILLIWLLILSMCVIDIITQPAREYQRIDYTFERGELMPQKGKQLNCICKCTEVGLNGGL
jgi:hypothetical protein